MISIFGWALLVNGCWFIPMKWSMDINGFYQWNSCCESDGVIFYFQSDPIFRMIILRVGRNHESLAVSHEGWANPRRAVYCILKYSQVANPMGVGGGTPFLTCPHFESRTAVDIGVCKKAGISEQSHSPWHTQSWGLPICTLHSVYLYIYNMYIYIYICI